MLDQFTARITPLGKDRTVRVWLPDEIERADTAYPVLYMFDGHNLFRDEWAAFGRAWRMDRFLARWEKPLIVVGIDCDQEGHNRLIEYSPYDMAVPPCGALHGVGPTVMEWMIGELKPLIDGRYPTIPFREATGIAGSSMGGLMSLFAVLRYNTWFSKAACLSSSFRFCRGQITEEAEQAVLDPDTRVYLSWGSAEFQNKSTLAYGTELNLTLNRILSRKGALTYPYLHTNGRHCEEDWEKEIPRFMDFLWME